MRYRLFLRDPAGRPLTLYGFKVLEDDPNYDSWHDVTTLFVRLLAGHVLKGEGRPDQVVATGVLRISALGFLRQLTHVPRESVAARFQVFFMRGLCARLRRAPGARQPAELSPRPPPAVPAPERVGAGERPAGTCAGASCPTRPATASS